MMFPSVWSSLLMVKRQALGTFVSLLMVILRGRRRRYLRGSPSRPHPPAPSHQPRPCSLLLALEEEEGLEGRRRVHAAATLAATSSSSFPAATMAPGPSRPPTAAPGGREVRAPP